jgi:hypothetical protein
LAANETGCGVIVGSPFNGLLGNADAAVNRGAPRLWSLATCSVYKATNITPTKQSGMPLGLAPNAGIRYAEEEPTVRSLLLARLITVFAISNVLVLVLYLIVASY